MQESPREQIRRAQRMLSEAEASPDDCDRFMRLSAAIYFARSALEQMAQSAVKTIDKMDKQEDDIKKWLTEKWAHGWLIQRLRFHDFHRHAMMSIDGGIRFQGPVGFSRKPGRQSHQSVSMALTTNGPVLSSAAQPTKNAEYKRSLCFAGDAVWDDTTDQWVKIADTVRLYLADAERMFALAGSRAWEKEATCQSAVGGTDKAESSKPCQ